MITKYRYSAFQFTPLELALRHHNADTVVLCGTQTNVCVAATSNDALFRGFHPVVVKDCVASGSLELHEAALRDLAERNGAVVTLEEVLKFWKVSQET